jgi:hypothetical protein
MTVGEVRSAIRGEVVTFRTGPFASGDTDDFVGQGIHVHFSRTGVCEAVEFGASTIPTFEGHPLLARPFQEVHDLLKVRDSSLEAHDTGLTSMLLGIGISMSSMEDWAADTDGVIVFERNYYH